MADADLIAIWKQGPEHWNQWRREHPGVVIDLSGAELRDSKHGRSFGAPEARYVDAHSDSDYVKTYSNQCRRIDLSYANLTDAKLHDTDFSHANFERADLTRADLERCNLTGANLRYTFFHEANLKDAYLRDTDFSWSRAERMDARGAIFKRVNLLRSAFIGCLFGRVSFRGSNLDITSMLDCPLFDADFRECTLSYAKFDGSNLSRVDFSGTAMRHCSFTECALVGTNLTDADISGSRIHGSSAWDIVRNDATRMNDLIITAKGALLMTVDDIEVAQFIYLLLNNAKVRSVINTITSKSVLILGRFTPERKQVLDGLRHALRAKNYLPMLFDFEKPDHRDLTETVATLAQLSCFVIADLTEAKSIPQELQKIVPNCPSLPVQPVLHVQDKYYGMFADLMIYPSVLPPFVYESEAHLLEQIEPHVIQPALRKMKEVEDRRALIRTMLEKMP